MFVILLDLVNDISLSANTFESKILENIFLKLEIESENYRWTITMRYSLSRNSSIENYSQEFYSQMNSCPSNEDTDSINR